MLRKEIDFGDLMDYVTTYNISSFQSRTLIIICRFSGTGTTPSVSANDSMQFRQMALLYINVNDILSAMRNKFPYIYIYRFFAYCYV